MTKQKIKIDVLNPEFLMAQVQLGDDAKDFKEFINKGTS